MSSLLVIRHAQASFLGADYDVLSPLGEEQARVLGRAWAAEGRAPDRVYVGPRRRQRQTAEAVGEAYRAAGVPWPEPQLLDALDEHSGQFVVDHAVAAYYDRYPELRVLADRSDGSGPPSPERRKALQVYFRVFREITRAWIREELETPPELEPWAAFRARIEGAVRRIVDGGGRGELVFAFTSGGPVAVSTGLALELADEKVLELSWRVRNTAYAEIVWSEEGLALNAFNAIEHLAEPRLVTYI